MRARFAVFMAAALAAIAVDPRPRLALCGEPTPHQDLRSAVDAMDNWLGEDRNGQRWRRFLKLRLLRLELVNEEVADATVVRDVLSRFSGATPGLERPKFAAVRRAIRAWLGELQAASNEDHAAAIEAAKQEFTPVSQDDVTVAKAKLRVLAERLDRYLATGGQNGLAWKQYLRSDELSAQLADDVRPDVNVLEAVRRRFAAGHDGLDLPVFADVRRAVRAYAEQIWAASGDDPEFWYAQRMELLSKTVNAVGRQPKRMDLRTLGLALGGLERRGFNRALVDAIRRRHSRPNLMLQVSGELLGAGFVETVDETQTVRDLILGTSISGTGRTQGTVSLKLVPSAERAKFEAIFEGTIRTRTVGRNGPARIGTRGVARIVGRKRVTFDAEGPRTTSTHSDAKMDTTTTGIWSTRCGPVDRIVRRVASRRLAQNKALAERIAADHAEEQFNERMDERVAELVRQGNRDFSDKFRGPLMERGEFPRLLRFNTGREFLYMTVLQASGYQLGAPDAPPPLVGEADLAVRLHESLLNNFASALLSGKTIEEGQFLADIESLLGSVPERLMPEEGAEPWVITFQPVRPIVVQFEDDVISITIRGRRYASGDRAVRQAYDITAEYQLLRSESGFKAIRTGDLRILPPGFVPGERTLSLREQNWRELLERRFGEIFENEISIEHLTLPGRWEDAGELMPVQMECDNGWLVLSWRLSSPVTGAVAQSKRNAARLAVASADN